MRSMILFQVVIISLELTGTHLLPGCNTTSYGQDCGQSCTCVPANTQDCNDVNGTCLCKHGWEGATCSDDIDECQVPSYCSGNFEQCNNLAGSAECLCEVGYSRPTPNDSCTGKIYIFLYFTSAMMNKS